MADICIGKRWLLLSPTIEMLYVEQVEEVHERWKGLNVLLTDEQVWWKEAEGGEMKRGKILTRSCLRCQEFASQKAFPPSWIPPVSSLEQVFIS